MLEKKFVDAKPKKADWNERRRIIFNCLKSAKSCSNKGDDLTEAIEMARLNVSAILQTALKRELQIGSFQS